MMQLEVDVPTTAAAVESSAAARRRRIHCLRSGGRAHASGGGARQRSGSAQHLYTKHGVACRIVRVVMSVVLRTL